MPGSTPATGRSALPSGCVSTVSPACGYALSAPPARPSSSSAAASSSISATSSAWNGRIPAD